MEEPFATHWLQCGHKKKKSTQIVRPKCLELLGTAGTIPFGSLRVSSPAATERTGITVRCNVLFCFFCISWFTERWFTFAIDFHGIHRSQQHLCPRTFPFFAIYEDLQAFRRASFLEHSYEKNPAPQYCGVGKLSYNG